MVNVVFAVIVFFLSSISTMVMVGKYFKDEVGVSITSAIQMKKECEAILPRDKQCIIYFKEEE